MNRQQHLLQLAERRLRRAAVAFCDGLSRPVLDAKDSAFKRRTRALENAAKSYTTAFQLARDKDVTLDTSGVDNAPSALL